MTPRQRGRPPLPPELLAPRRNGPRPEGHSQQQDRILMLERKLSRMLERELRAREAGRVQGFIEGVCWGMGAADVPFPTMDAVIREAYKMLGKELE